ncbi:hypothetical protein V8B55DRAFT_1435482 [Mucor lusitanicus]|uniref:Uncharacterized protein n=1 Tax=Mucor lusitanicus CBS 277.49 TaxID=747725 RepID=A0A168GJ63_MUCCL|nr:hypothetical protein MUCCIDRAFT_116224 [Mucor lusitanicus CBS 277.49]
MNEENLGWSDVDAIVYILNKRMVHYTLDGSLVLNGKSSQGRLQLYQAYTQAVENPKQQWYVTKSDYIDDDEFLDQDFYEFVRQNSKLAELGQEYVKSEQDQENHIRNQDGHEEEAQDGEEEDNNPYEESNNDSYEESGQNDEGQNDKGQNDEGQNDDERNHGVPKSSKRSALDATTTRHHAKRPRRKGPPKNTVSPRIVIDKPTTSNSTVVLENSTSATNIVRKDAGMTITGSNSVNYRDFIAGISKSNINYEYMSNYSVSPLPYHLFRLLTRIHHASIDSLRQDLIIATECEQKGLPQVNYKTINFDTTPNELQEFNLQYSALEVLSKGSNYLKHRLLYSFAKTLNDKGIFQSDAAKSIYVRKAKNDGVPRREVTRRVEAAYRILQLAGLFDINAVIFTSLFDRCMLMDFRKDEFDFTLQMLTNSAAFFQEKFKLVFASVPEASGYFD